jgi:hypothetical protein
MRSLKIKKTKHLNLPVNVLTRKDGRIDVVSGLFKGYLGGDILVDTGNGGLYDHVVMGSAPGASLVVPASMTLSLQKPKARKVGKKSAPLYFDDEDVLSNDWRDEIFVSDHCFTGKEYFSVAESFYQ